jgi:hypothetical protein
VLGTRELLGEGQRPRRTSVAIQHLDVDQPLGDRDRGLHRIGQALADLRLHHQPVDHHRDVVLELLVQLDRLVQQPQLPVHLDPGEALRAQLVE